MSEKEKTLTAPAPKLPPQSTTLAPVAANGSQAEESPRQRRKQNEEIQLLSKIDRLLSEVDPSVAKRIVAWLAQEEFGGEWLILAPEKKT